jgi:dTDP-4-amino-4,6-dideoxygalactose transaminase
MENTTHNYSYFPVFVEKDYPLTRDELYEKLKENNIFARRYFYPLVSEFPMYRHLSSADKNYLPNAAKLADEVICLPMYADLTQSCIEKIIKLCL